MDTLPLLLDLSANLELVRVLSFENRVLNCQTLDGKPLKVFYPGASKHFPPPLAPFLASVKAYDVPRPKCTHAIVAADARIHTFVDQSKPCWIGISTLYNNHLFKSILDQNLWPNVQTYKQQVKLGSSRVDFLLNDSEYVEIKADFALAHVQKKSRLLKHLELLNTKTKSAVVFIAPYDPYVSALYKGKYAAARVFLRSFKNITFYWVYVTYDLYGRIYLKAIVPLSAERSIPVQELLPEAL